MNGDALVTRRVNLVLSPPPSLLHTPSFPPFLRFLRGHHRLLQQGDCKQIRSLSAKVILGKRECEERIHSLDRELVDIHSSRTPETEIGRLRSDLCLKSYPDFATDLGCWIFIFFSVLEWWWLEKQRNLGGRTITNITRTDEFPDESMKCQGYCNTPSGNSSALVIDHLSLFPSCIINPIIP
jgi:hypothetical protein